MIERLDARAAKWPRPARWSYLSIKWTLVALGAYGFVGLYVQRYGWAATAWFILAPVVFAVLQAVKKQSTGR